MKVLINLDSQDIQHRGLFLAALHKAGYHGPVTAKQLELNQLLQVAKEAGCEAVVCSNVGTLQDLVQVGPKFNPSDWRGARINLSVPVLVVQPAAHLVQVAHGAWLLEQDLAKLTQLAKPVHLYSYTICTSLEHLNQARQALMLPSLGAVVFDIETSKQNTITSVAFTALTRDGHISHTFCVPLEGWATDQELTDAYLTIKAILEYPESYKAAHNASFDCFHLLRHHIAPVGVVWDTEYLWWAWHAELEKSLAFISSVLLPDYYYWKYEAEQDKLGYNCKDTINTARCLVALLKTAPVWAFQNYSKTIAMQPALIAMAFEGFKVDTALLDKLRPEALERINNRRASLAVATATPAFNPGSWQQVQCLFYQVLGAKRPRRTSSAAGTDATALKEIALQHPLVARFVADILEYRKQQKAYSTYYCADLLADRILYSLQADGTDTARLSSNKSSLYSNGKDRNYGLQIQNVPPYMRKALVADPGYLLGEVDKSQAEARCTAYLADCPLLIEDLETAGRDFYCYMAYRFFGLTITKADPLRQLVKKIVHGTNYMMQAATFIDVVGIKELQGYQALLPSLAGLSLLDFAKHCLAIYQRVYPEVVAWWRSTAVQVAAYGLVTTPDGWTRQVFGNPLQDSAVQRSVVAHQPQHLSVAVLNWGLVQAFHKLQAGSGGQFRLKAQIHDSILFQATIPTFDNYMSQLITILDKPINLSNGKVLRIPTDAKVGTVWGSMTAWSKHGA